MTRHQQVTAVLLSMLVVSCENPTDSESGDLSIQIEGPAEVRQNRSIQLSATVRDGGGEIVDAADVEWSADSDVVSVDGAGRVTGLREGTARVTASAAGASAYIDLTVTAGVVTAIGGFTIPSRLIEGTSITLDLVALDDQGMELLDREVELWSESPAIVSAGAGRVEALAEGEALVLVQAGTIIEGARIEVVPEATYTGMVNIIAVDGTPVSPHDTLEIAAPSFDLTVRIALGEGDMPPDFIIVEESTGLQWNALESPAQAGDTVDVIVPLTGPVFGVTEIRVAAASMVEGPLAQSPPVYLKSTDPYLEASIVLVNGVPVDSGVMRVAERFDVVLRVDVPDGVTIPVSMIGLYAPELGTYVGVHPEGASTLGPGEHEFVISGPVAPAGRYVVEAVVLHGARAIPVDRVEVEVTNSDVTKPSLSAFGGSDTIVVAVQDPPILVDMADGESGLFGIRFTMNWQVVGNGYAVGPCSSTYGGYFLPDGVVHEAQWLFHVSECFGFRLNPGDNPMTIGVRDNAMNEGTVDFVLVYDPDAEGAAHAVHIGRAGARAISPAQAAVARMPIRALEVSDRAAGRERLFDSRGAVVEHTVVKP